MPQSSLGSLQLECIDKALFDFRRNLKTVCLCLFRLPAFHNNLLLSCCHRSDLLLQIHVFSPPKSFNFKLNHASLGSVAPSVGKHVMHKLCSRTFKMCVVKQHLNLKFLHHKSYYCLQLLRWQIKIWSLLTCGFTVFFFQIENPLLSTTL